MQSAIMCDDDDPTHALAAVSPGFISSGMSGWGCICCWVLGWVGAGLGAAYVSCPAFGLGV